MAKRTKSETVKAAQGQPSMMQLTQKVTAAIQEDPRWDTDQHGAAEGSPSDYEPYCIDVLLPDATGGLVAVIHTDDGRTVKHGFAIGDDGCVTMADGDSEPTEMTQVYAKAIEDAEVGRENANLTGIVRCRLASSTFDASAETPTSEFQWMPAGVTEIVAGFGNGSIHMFVECDERGAKAVADSFERAVKASPRRRPFGCVEHREEEAAFHPMGFEWRDEPEPGIYCTAEWTKLGVNNVRGKIHTSFSPSFSTDAEYDRAENKDGTFEFPDGVRGSRSNPARVTGVSSKSVGSLTNWPAFKNILPVKAKQADQGTVRVLNDEDKKTSASDAAVPTIERIYARFEDASKEAQEISVRHAPKVPTVEEIYARAGVTGGPAA